MEGDVKDIYVFSLENLLFDYKKNRGILYYFTKDPPCIRTAKSIIKKIKASPRNIEFLSNQHIDMLTESLLSEKTSSKRSIKKYLLSLAEVFGKDKVALCKTLYKKKLWRESYARTIFEESFRTDDFLDIIKYLEKEKAFINVAALLLNYKNLNDYLTIIRAYSITGVLNENVKKLYFYTPEQVRTLANIILSTSRISQLLKTKSFFKFINQHIDSTESISTILTWAWKSEHYEECIEIVTNAKKAELGVIEIIFDIFQRAFGSLSKENSYKLFLMIKEDAIGLLNILNLYQNHKIDINDFNTLFQYRKNFSALAAELSQQKVGMEGFFQLAYKKKIIPLLLLLPPEKIKKMLVILNYLGRREECYYLADSLKKNITYIDGLYAALNTLKNHHLLSPENIADVCSNPKYAEDIADAHQTFIVLLTQKLSLTEQIKKHLIRHIKHWSKVTGFLSIYQDLQRVFIDEMTFTYKVNILIGRFLPCLHVLMRFFKYAAENSVKDRVLRELIYKEDQCPLSVQALQIWDEELQNSEQENYPQELMIMIGDDKEDILLFSKACHILYLNKMYDKDGKFDFHKSLLKDADVSCAKLIIALNENGLGTKENFEIILNLKEVKNFTIAEPNSPYLKSRLITSLQQFQHPLVYFILGKIFSGEMWGVDENFDMNAAAECFNQIPSDSSFYAETLFCLYNMRTSDEVEDEESAYERLMLTSALLANKVDNTDMLKRVHDKLEVNHKIKKVVMGKFIPGLFQSYEHYLQMNKEQCRQEFDKRFGLVVRK